MERQQNFVQLKTGSGTAIERGNLRIRPEAQALTVRLPFMGFVWNRPVAIVVEKDGRQERFAIFDATRATVLALVAIGLAVSLGTFLASFLWKSRK